MDGIFSTSQNGSHLAVLKTVSDEFVERIKERLASFCYGAHTVQTDDFYSLHETIEDFFERFDSKNHETQLGMVGELLSHLIMPDFVPKLTPVSTYFNKEDRSIKKGFDLVFFDEVNHSVWYVEVKTGETNPDQTVAKKTSALFKTGADDLYKMLTGAPLRSRWQSAKIDTLLVLGEAKSSSVKKALNLDYRNQEADHNNHKNAILIAVAICDDMDHPIQLAEVKNERNKWIAQARFNDIQLAALQQEHLTVVTDRMRMEKDDGNND